MESIAQIIDALAAEGHDPDTVLPLYALLAESANAAVLARRQDDMLLATVNFGRVTAILDIIEMAGIPAPFETAADLLEHVEAIFDADEAGDAAAE